jgi:hypothetical protein
MNRAAPVSAEVLLLVLRGLAPWPQGFLDPAPGARVAVRSIDCADCRAWRAALVLAHRPVSEAADAAQVDAGPFAVCEACRADRRTARTLAAHLHVRLVPTSPRKAVRTLGALAELAGQSRSGA